MIIEILLLVLLVAIFVFPFIFRKIEAELEIFLFTAGVLAVTIAWQWSTALVMDALIEPVTITVAVFLAGLIFKFIEHRLSKAFARIIDKIGQKWFFFIMILLLGMISSIVTAIIAALILVEITIAIGLEKEIKIRFTVLACFSIGLGAILSPVGEPLAVIIIAKLSGAPYHAEFWYLFEHTWFYIIPSIVALGILSTRLINHGQYHATNEIEDKIKVESISTITKRAVKVYVFIIGLVFLGKGFAQLMETIMANIPPKIIYWFNSISAVLDNATLASAEIWPSMSLAQIISAILSLTMAGGMLIPGNIPNIVAAGKLEIKSKQWAKVGLPLGIVLMAFFFLVLFL